MLDLSPHLWQLGILLLETEAAIKSLFVAFVHYFLDENVSGLQ